MLYTTGLIFQAGGTAAQIWGETGYAGFNLSSFLADCTRGATRELGQRMVTRSYDDKIDLQDLAIDAWMQIKHGATRGACTSLSNSLITFNLLNFIPKHMMTSQRDKVIAGVSIKALGCLSEKVIMDIALSSKEELNAFINDPELIYSKARELLEKSIVRSVIVNGGIVLSNMITEKLPIFGITLKANVILSDIYTNEALEFQDEDIQHHRVKRKSL